MRVIKERFLFCLFGIVVCAFAIVFFICVSTWHAVILFASAAIIPIILAVKTSGSYRSARLICEKPILKVGVASVSVTSGSTAESTVNVVVSGFGILMDGKPYKFGHGGVDLTATTVDRESITLSFKGEEKSYSVRLLHGIADRAYIDELTDRLRYETEIVADVSGW